MAASGRIGNESNSGSCETRVTSNNFQALIIVALMQYGEFMRLKVTTMVFWRQLLEGQREAFKTETQVCTVACSPRKKQKRYVEDRAIPVIRVRTLLLTFANH